MARKLNLHRSEIDVNKLKKVRKILFNKRKNNKEIRIKEIQSPHCYFDTIPILRNR